MNILALNFIQPDCIYRLPLYRLTINTSNWHFPFLSFLANIKRLPHYANHVNIQHLLLSISSHFSHNPVSLNSLNTLKPAPLQSSSPLRSYILKGVPMSFCLLQSRFFQSIYLSTHNYMISFPQDILSLSSFLLK